MIVRNRLKQGKWYLLLPLLGLVACIAIRQPVGPTTVVLPSPGITVQDLGQLLRSGRTVLILDVRTPEEFDGPLGHIEGALLIPIQELETRMDELSAYRDQEMYVICRSGGRSARATGMLIEAGYEATNVVGGMEAWNMMKEDVKGQVE